MPTVTVEERTYTAHTSKEARDVRIATEREASPLTLLTQPQVLAILNKTKMALWRWLNAPECAHLKFPRPLYINSRPHWKKRELEAWINSRTRERS